MSNITSPQRFSGTGTFDHFYDGHYEPDLSTQMKVPKRIRVTGGEERDEGTWKERGEECFGRLAIDGVERESGKEGERCYGKFCDKERDFGEGKG